jgi:hypothetical protein
MKRKGKKRKEKEREEKKIKKKERKRKQNKRNGLSEILQDILPCLIVPICSLLSSLQEENIRKMAVWMGVTARIFGNWFQCFVRFCCLHYQGR